MILPKSKWNILYEKPYSDNEIIDILHKNKGIDDYIQYLNLGYKDFNDPYLFKNMDAVVKKIKLSIKNNEKILIFGDYDVDGITATAIMYRTLKHKGADCYYMVPNRFGDGYGLSPDAVSEAVKAGFKLIITVDNGITGIDEVNALEKAGVSVIVTDHHEPKDVLPNASYIIHSYIFNDYPYSGFCGAGVSYKICEALDKDFAREMIDLCMLGTIADMMPQTGENKAIINEGLKVVNNTHVLGLKMLLDELNLKVSSIKDISFNVAPKLNSLGRIGDASIAIDLLVQDDKEKIKDDIEKLLEADSLRKELTIQNTDLAYKMIDPNDKVCIIYSPSFYEGVLGIIAQKVMKKTGKITGVFNIVKEENLARGSFRTIGDYNILEMLEKNKDLLDKFGGHEKACGVNMKASNIKELKERLSKEVETLYDFEQVTDVECTLNHSLITKDFIKELALYDMQETLFHFKDLNVVSTIVLSDKHTKVKVRLKNGFYVSILVFNDPYLCYNLSPGDPLEIVGELSINSFNGFDSIQIIARDYKVSGIQVIDYRLRKDFNEIEKYLNQFDGLIVKDEFDSIADIKILLEEQSPSIVFLAPYDYSREEDARITDLELLKKAFYIISRKTQINELLLMKDLKISKNLLNKILTIFKEVDLVNVNSGIIQAVSHEKGYKVNLEDSSTFKEYLLEKEAILVYRSDYKTIKNFVIEALE